MKNPKLSIVIPAYNEEKIIKGNLIKIIDYLLDKSFSWEIIVVDDGSRDTTSQEITSIKSKNVSLLKLEKNVGKGGALKKGFLKARGENIIFMDADLSVPLSYIDVFIKKLSVGADVVIASRRVKGSKIIVHQPFLRENLGRGFTLLTNLVTGSKITDFTCGFKGFTRASAKKIWGNTIVKRWSYDAEIIFLANKYKFNIVQVPVEWKNRRASRVSIGIDTFTSLRDLIKIRLNDFAGKYDKK